MLLGLDGDNLQGQDLSNIVVVETGTGEGDGGRQLASLSLGDTAKIVANLLGQSLSLQSQKGTRDLDGQTVYIGEGLPPVPPKLVHST